MQYIQCFPLYNAAALKRLTGYAANAGAEILLDLEDSIGDASSAAITYKLKQNARSTLIELADFLISRQAKTKIHIRINAVGSSHFADDIECLKNLNGLKLESLFIPKVSSDWDLLIPHNALSETAIQFNYLSPIAETTSGMYFFQNQYQSNSFFKIKTVYFGNYDYNLSCGNYPLIEQSDKRYWETVIPLIKKVEHSGLTFGNSPYANLEDTDTFILSIDRLKEICKNDFYVCCLNLAQTKIAQALSCGAASYDSVSLQNMPVADVPADFAMYRSKGRSFAYLPHKKKIITPHEYLLSMEKSYSP